MSTPLFGGDETVPMVCCEEACQCSQCPAHKEHSSPTETSVQVRKPRLRTCGDLLKVTCLGLKSKPGHQARRHRSVWAHVSRTEAALPEHRTDLPHAELSLNKALCQPFPSLSHENTRRDQACYMGCGYTGYSFLTLGLNANDYRIHLGCGRHFLSQGICLQDFRGSGIIK